MRDELAVAAAVWGVVMALSPSLQIRQMLKTQSSRDVSVGYFAVLIPGFLLWIAYGVSLGNVALIVPNAVSTGVGLTLIAIALRLRRRMAPASGAHAAVPAPTHAQGARADDGSDGKSPAEATCR